MTALFEPNAKARIVRDFDLDVSVRKDGPPAAVRSRFRLPFGAIGHASALADAVAVVVASLVGGAGYQIAVNQTAGHLGTLAGVGIVAALLHGLIGQSRALYQLGAILSFRRSARETVGIWIAVSLLLTLLAFLMKVGAEFSRGPASAGWRWHWFSARDGWQVVSRSSPLLPITCRAGGSYWSARKKRSQALKTGSCCGTSDYPRSIELFLQAIRTRAWC
jgi:hypothetical protein